MTLNFNLFEKYKWFIYLFVLTLLVGCVPEKESKKDKAEIRFIYTKIGEQEFVIPKPYLKYSYPKLEDTSVYLQMMYPDYKFMTEQPKILREKGEWYKNITVNFIDISQTRPIKDAIKSAIEFFNATKIVGDQYGLIYRTYPEGSKIRRGELWVEKSGSAYITCSTPSRIMDSGRPTRPQCNHRFIWRKQYVSISIDYRLLPHWQEIKENVIRLLGKFDVTGRELPPLLKEKINGAKLHRIK